MPFSICWDRSRYSVRMLTDVSGIRFSACSIRSCVRLRFFGPFFLFSDVLTFSTTFSGLTVNLGGCPVRPDALSKQPNFNARPQYCQAQYCGRQTSQKLTRANGGELTATATFKQDRVTITAQSTKPVPRSKEYTFKNALF